MRNQLVVVIFFLACLYVLVGCSEKTLEKTPPIPKVASEKILIPVTQSSYCWERLGCADYVGGKAMLEGKTPTVVAPESNIRITFDYEPAPSQLIVQQFMDEHTIDVPLQDGYFQVPKEKGVYYYGLSAYWTSEDGKYSKGNTSSVFFIDVQ